MWINPKEDVVLEAIGIFDFVLDKSRIVGGMADPVTNELTWRIYGGLNPDLFRVFWGNQESPYNTLNSILLGSHVSDHRH